MAAAVVAAGVVGVTGMMRFGGGGSLMCQRFSRESRLITGAERAGAVLSVRLSAASPLALLTAFAQPRVCVRTSLGGTIARIWVCADLDPRR